MNTTTIGTVTNYAVLRKSLAPWAPVTEGIDITSDTYTNLINAGWIVTHTWTATHTDHRTIAITNDVVHAGHRSNYVGL